MAKVLRKEDQELWRKVLQLVECMHLSYLCKGEYEANCRTENKWIVQYVAQATEEICMNRADFDTAFSNAGCQMQTLLERATALVMSSTKTIHSQRVAVWHRTLGRVGHSWMVNMPIQMDYDAHAKQKASRMQIAKIHTT